MPQGDQKDLKAKIAQREKLLKLAKDHQKAEEAVAAAIEKQGTASDKLLKTEADTKKALDRSQKDFIKGSQKTEEAIKSNVEVAKEWADAIIDKVGKAQKDAEKNQKSLSKSFREGTAHVADMGEALIEAKRDEGTAKLLEGFNGINLQIDQMVEGITEFSDDKMAQLLEQQQEYNKKLKKSKKLNDKQSKVLDDIASKAQESAKGMSEAAVKGKKFTEHMSTAKGRANMLAVAISAVGAAMEKVADTAEKIQQSLGTSSKTSLKMAFSWKKIGLSMVGLSEPLSDARREISLAASDITMMNSSGDQLARNMTWVARNTGMATKTLAEMQETLMLTTDLSREQAGLMIMGLEGFVKEAGGIPKEVFDDIATSAEEIAKFSDGTADSLLRAATMANKLGINLKTAGTMASSLLNLEQSIASEFEASVLIGRELNYDKARTLALNNNIEGAMKEIINQLGSEEEFLAMNAIQRQAIADSIGVSVDDISKMVGYGAEGGGEVPDDLKIAKQSNKGIWQIVSQLTPGAFKTIISMLTKGLVGLLGFKAMKTGIVAGLKTMGIDASKFTKGFSKGITKSIGGFFKGFKTFFGKWGAKALTFLKGLGPIARILGKAFIVLSIMVDLWRGVSSFFGLGSDKTGEERKKEKRKGAGILIGGLIGGALGAIGGPVGIGIGAGIGAWIGEAMSGMDFSALKQLADPLIAYWNAIVGAWTPLVKKIKAVVGKITAIFSSDGPDSIGTKLGKATAELIKAIPGIVWSLATGIFDGFIAAIKLVFVDGPAALSQAVKDMGVAIGPVLKDFFSGLGTEMKNAASAVFDDISAYFTTLGASMKATATQIYDDVKTYFSELATNIANAIGEAFKDMGTRIHAALINIPVIGKLIEGAGSFAKWAFSDDKAADDFVWRPDQGLQKFSSDDTILGLKDVGKLSEIGSKDNTMPGTKDVSAEAIDSFEKTMSKIEFREPSQGIEQFSKNDTVFGTKGEGAGNDALEKARSKIEFKEMQTVMKEQIGMLQVIANKLAPLDVIAKSNEDIKIEAQRNTTTLGK